MKKLTLILSTLTMVATQLHATPFEASLVDSSDVVYIGSFNPPANSSSTGETFAWAGQGLTYNPHNNSLFMTGHDHYQLVGEISIPELSVNPDPANLNFSELLQPFTDITEGNMANLGVGGTPLSAANNNMKIGGLLVDGERLIGTAFPYYEDATEADRSHFVANLSFATNGIFDGMLKLGDARPGILSGYMGTIPTEWQPYFQATALTGNACTPIISRSSQGPAVATFTPGAIGTDSSNQSTVLIEYPTDHMTLGTYTNEEYENPVFNMTTAIKGVVFPKNSRTVLFFGKTGLGVPEYGAGTDDITLDGEQVPGFDEYYIYDPANPLSKGGHAWPYTAYVWAYDAAELVEVQRGEKEPWEVVPYATWSLELPYGDTLSTFLLGGAAYDEEKNIIYISQQRIRRERPVIHAFAVNRDAAMGKKSAPSTLISANAQLQISGSILVQTTDFPAGEYEISVVDIQGKALSVNTNFLSNETSEFTVDSKLAEGLYFLTMKNSMGKTVWKTKIVK